MNVETIRTELAEYLNAAPKGTAARIADRAGISKTTVSKFLHRRHKGDNERIAKLIAEILRSEKLAVGIQEGRFEVQWLVRIGDTLRIVKWKRTVERLQESNDHIHVIPIYVGPAIDEVFAIT